MNKGVKFAKINLHSRLRLLVCSSGMVLKVSVWIKHQKLYAQTELCQIYNFLCSYINFLFFLFLRYYRAQIKGSQIVKYILVKQ